MDYVVHLSEAEWSTVISAVAAQHPIIAKISQQIVQQKGANHAGREAYTQGQHPQETASMGAHPGVGGIPGAASRGGDPNGQWGIETSSQGRENSRPEKP
ncbi:MAG: hypothetical protein J2P17_33040 [Mycobacterium sp.]|nr:hypothetical protein [Mycobacterium sp.]